MTMMVEVETIWARKREQNMVRAKRDASMISRHIAYTAYLKMERVIGAATFLVN
jgi:hypothetical protein